MSTNFEKDGVLGARIHKLLSDNGIETPCRWKAKRTDQEALRTDLVAVLTRLRLDIMDDSLQETPRRLAKMFTEELFYGLDYGNFPKCTTVENKMSYRQMASRVGIEVKSMCEHHFLPIVGRATIAYLPSAKVMGLSKFDRVVDFFSRRPQVQERLTEQVAFALKEILETDHVAVVIHAKHFCISHRGVKGSVSDTVTSRLYGHFMDQPPLRGEFLNLAHAKHPD